MGLCMSNNKQEGGNAQKTENKPVDKKPAAAEKKEEPKKEEPKKAEEKKEEPKKAEEKKEEPKKAEEKKKEEPKKEEPKKEEPKKEEPKKETPKAATAAAEGTQDSPKTGCEDYPLASGSYTLQDYEFDEKTKKTKAPNMSSWPAVTNDFVTDGKVVFDKAALSIPGIIPTRADEVKELERVFTLKGEASELTKEAATIHDASQPFFKEADEAHKAGEHEKKHAALNKGKAMMEDAKKLRAQAQEKHDLCNKIGRAVSISMAIKAAYSKEFEYNPWPSKTDTMYPSADWHVFTESAMEESIDAVWEVFSKNKFGCKSFLAIPGAGSHSTGPKGCVTIPVYKEFVKRHGFEKNETQITSGSWLLKF